MTPLEMSLSALSVVLGFGIVAMGQRYVKALARVIDLEIDVTRHKGETTRYQAMAYELAAQRDKALSASLRLDAKTAGLVRLAASNPDRNEAASAALIVCDRLKKRLG